MKPMPLPSAAVRPAWVLLLVAAIGASGCSTTTERLNLPPLEPVPEVDLERYLGTWYEIASYPQRFQKGCTGTTATYTLRDDGEIDVLNRCRLGTLDGEEKTAEGRARIPDKASSSKLEVSFFGPFWGDYWVIFLDEDYRWAVVGHPSRDYLWVLSRTPQISDEQYAHILERLTAVGYPLDRLERTPQPATGS